MVNNSFHPHVWYANSGDEFHTNIVMTDVKGIRAPTETATGKYIDKNLFFVTDHDQKDKYAEQGWDLNSIVGDPLFMDPGGGDFRVKEGSPALEIGFKNFPMDQFGVKKPALKAIAEAPVIPDLDIGTAESTPSSGPVPTTAAEVVWLGAKLHDLKGEEFSAYGTRKEDGGVALAEVPETSEAARYGLKENDLIQAVNGQQVANSRQLFTALAEFAQAPLKVTLVRNQQVAEIALASSSYVIVETSDTAEGFASLPLPSAPSGKATANQSTANQPLAALVDGRLVQDYGPVFRNGISNGVYKMDLGETRRVTAVSSWSFNQNGRRGVQKVTLYGSSSTTDPGWDLTDRARFAPLGSVDTSGGITGAFNAASLRAREGQVLGEFRWILWCVFPVTQLDENTAFQELAVEVAE
jgi:membrane-associated protease RseP (regulator of RpoE activity)